MVFRPGFDVLKKASQDFYLEADNMPEKFTVTYLCLSQGEGGVQIKEQTIRRNKYRRSYYEPDLVLQKRGVTENYDGSKQQMLLYNKPHGASCYGHITVLENDWNRNGSFHVTINVTEDADETSCLQQHTGDPLHVNYRVIRHQNMP